eukprot:Awhi_evm1s13032
MSINRAQVTYKIKLCDDERVLRRPSVLFTSRPQSKNNFITSIPQRSRSQSELGEFVYVDGYDNLDILWIRGDE